MTRIAGADLDRLDASPEVLLDRWVRLSRRAQTSSSMAWTFSEDADVGSKVHQSHPPLARAGHVRMDRCHQVRDFGQSLVFRHRERPSPWRLF